MMEPADLPRVWRVAEAQNRRDGTNYPVPPIFEMNEESTNFGRLLPNVICALVTEVNGRVRAGHLWLRSVEEMSFGGDAATVAFSMAHIPMVLEMLRARGYDALHVLVPHRRVPDLAALLEAQGLNQIDHRLAHFFRTI